MWLEAGRPVLVGLCTDKKPWWLEWGQWQWWLRTEVRRWAGLVRIRCGRQEKMSLSLNYPTSHLLWYIEIICLWSDSPTSSSKCSVKLKVIWSKKEKDKKEQKGEKSDLIQSWMEMQVPISFHFLASCYFMLSCLKFSFKVNESLGGWLAAKSVFSALALVSGYRNELNELGPHQSLVLRSSLSSRETQWV